MQDGYSNLDEPPHESIGLDRFNRSASQPRKRARTPHTMASRQNVVTVVIANLLIPLAMFIFAIGFFPYKPFIPGRAKFTDDDVQSAPFDKVVFMVVDALRRFAILCYAPKYC